jgi:protocatechuate 3,4-dioxygenase beta subunit
VTLKLVNLNDNCAPVAGYAVYLWHCDALGRYSLYSSGVTTQNYLRGVQVSDADGNVTFTTIFPGAYSGRWPHIHFEVFPSLDVATDGSNAMAVSQIAFPADVSRAVYATDGYSQSVRNMARTSLEDDMVFSDGHALQTPTMTGDPTAGYTAALVVGV